MEERNEAKGEDSTMKKQSWGKKTRYFWPNPPFLLHKSKDNCVHTHTHTHESTLESRHDAAGAAFRSVIDA